MYQKLKPYLVTVSIIAATTLLKIFLDQVTSIDSPFLLFFSATTFCALYGGRLQGFVAIFLSLVSSYIFFVEPNTFFDNDSTWPIRFLFYTADCTLIILICSKLSESRDKLRKALNDIGLVGQAQKFLDSVIENIPNMIFVKDAKDLRFVRLNRAGEDLIGLKKIDMIGKTDYDFFPKDQADFFAEKDRKVLEGKSIVDIVEEPIRTSMGTRYLHTKKIPLLDTDGKVQYLLGISEDITEKKEAEIQRLSLIQEQLARSEAEKSAQRLTFLSEASAILSETLDINTMLGSIVKIMTSSIADGCAIDLLDEATNQITRVAYSYKDHERNSLVTEYIKEHPVHNQSGHRSIHVIKTGRSDLFKKVTEDDLRLFSDCEAHFEVLRKISIESVIIAPMKYYGKTIGALTIVSINPSHHYDEFDLSMIEDLNKRISFALENAKLYSKSQEASRTKSAFLANMSHEIRTPLGAMLGFAELMLGAENLGQEEQEYLSIIARNGKQLIRIVDEILDLSKIESEAIRIEYVPFLLHPLMDEVISLLKVQAEKKQLSFNIEYLSQVNNAIISDPTRLRQILINVIGNAIKFTDKGGVKISMELLPSDSQKNILQFKVQDSGIGISVEQEKALFQPFAQADDSTTRKYGGTGLGLFLSKKLARLLGGDLILDRNLSVRGSTFIISIEVKSVGPSLLKPKTPLNDDKKTQKNSEDGKGKVLIVDDVTDNRTLLSYHVSRVGFETDVAESGKIGVQKALQQPYDIILMDVQMPEMDGFEAVKQLREQNYRGAIVAVTAYAMKGDKERCLEKGFDDYLTKPIDKETLEKILSTFTKKAVMEQSKKPVM